MNDRLLKESDVIEAFKGRESLIHDVYTATAIIKSVPTADRPQGEWIVSDKDSVCSVCGKDEAEFICGTEDWYGYGLSKYCPNCGARMRGVNDE